MVFATSGADLIDRLALSLGVERVALAQGLWIGLGLSLLYLLTLLTTRWGEQHALVKALVFSAMIHVFSTLTWVASSSVRTSETVVAEPEQPPPPFEMLILSEDALDEAQPGTHDFWERLPMPLDTEAARIDPQRLELAEPETPARTATPQPTTTEVPDLKPLPAQPPDPPQVQRNSPEALARAAPVPLPKPQSLTPTDSKPVPKPQERLPVPDRKTLPADSPERIAETNALDSPAVSDLQLFPEQLPTAPRATPTAEPRIAKLEPVPVPMLEPDRLQKPSPEQTPRPREQTSRPSRVVADAPARTGPTYSQETPAVSDLGLLPQLPSEVPLARPELPPETVARVPVPSAASTQPERLPSANVIAPPQPRPRTFVERNSDVDLDVPRSERPQTVATIPRDFDPRRPIVRSEALDDPREFLRRTEPKLSKSQPASAVMPEPLPPLSANVPSDGETGGPVRTRTDSRIAAVEKPIERYQRERIDEDSQRSRTVRMPGGVEPLPEATAGPVDVVRPDFPPPGPTRKVALPPTYRHRSPIEREKAVASYGGSQKSEQAVELSLRWLAANQTGEGYWDAAAHGAGQVALDREGLDTRGAPVRGGIPGVHADTGVTALAVLAFLGRGYTHEEGPYTQNVGRALRWLIGQQREDGYLGGNATHYAQAYCHAMATYALAEAYGMRADPSKPSSLRLPLQRAIDFTLSQQNPNDGGWRYQKGQISDMSIFGWNLMALKSAEIAGLEIPAQSKNLMIQFLRDRSLGKKGGLAAYHVDIEGQNVPTPTMTAESLFCKQMLGMSRGNPASTEAVEYLLGELPSRTEYNFYYWYYGTLAMYQHGGTAWKKWNDSLRDLIVQDQITEGEQAGSWEPRDRWGGYGGRVYSTAMATLSLEVYYRLLPLYKSQQPQP